ncbi:MAG: M56 family metallopeptidase [Isosphaeraceae bacterium]|nr:M56 family metallopeptidase [Isosphaeraceae bacterium]
MEWLAQACLSNALVATLLALLAAVAGTFVRRPALTHGLWLLVLIKLVTPPVAPVALLPAPAEMPPIAADALVDRLAEGTPVTDGDAVEEPAPGAPVEDRSITDAAVAPAGLGDPFQATRRWLLATWGAGALGWWGLAAWRIVRFRRSLNDAHPADAELRDQVELLAGRLGLKSCPRIAFVPGRIPPLVWSIGVPRLILPEALWATLEPEARESLLTHELAHLRRRDHWTRWLELWTGGLYWWLPVVWWARRALREAEEQCCDAWVVAARPEAARTYAHALLATLDFLSEPRPAVPLGASGIGHVSCLKRRMTMIVRAQTPKALSWRGRLAVLALGATLLPLTPTWAQREETPKDPPPAPEATPREDTSAPKPSVSPARERINEYRRALDRLVISDEHLKKQLDEALSQMEKAFDAGIMSEDGIRNALDRVRRDVDESLERIRLAQRERREADEEPKGREETPERRELLEKTRAEIRELQAKLRQAEGRLAALEGRPVPKIRAIEDFVRSRKVDPRAESPARSGGASRSVSPNPSEQPAAAPERRPTPGMPPREADGPRSDRAGRAAGPRGGDGRLENPPREDGGPRADTFSREPSARTPGVPEQRVRQLEEKLETLLKEMQSLKNELRGGDRQRSR